MNQLNLLNEAPAGELPDYTAEFRNKLPGIRQTLEKEKGEAFQPQQDLPEALINYALVTLYHVQENNEANGVPGKAVEQVWVQLTQIASELWEEIAGQNIQATLTKNFYFKLNTPGALDQALEFWKTYRL